MLRVLQARLVQAAMSRSLVEIVDTHPKKKSSALQWFYNRSVHVMTGDNQVLHSLPTHTADSSLKGLLTMGSRDFLVATSF